LSEVFQGRVFTNEFARDVFFLRQIRERYPAQWPSLLAVNITVGDYVVESEKLRRFVEEAGVAGENTDDPSSCASLAGMVTNTEFYTNISRPEIQEAAALSLIEIGPTGRLALANAFTQTHYQLDPESLEFLANAIGNSGVSDPDLSRAVAAAAFTLTTTNGGSYPRCTREAVRSLLRLANGPEALRSHLNTNEVFNDPGRFQAVIDGVAEARCDSLANNLESLADAVKIKLPTLAPGPDPYRDDLADLQTRLQKTIQSLRSTAK
jgi:hypothetical protein